MNSRFAHIDRRTLLIGGGVGVGLIVAFAAWPRGLESDLATRDGESAFGHFLKIGRDGRVTVAVPQAEIGQGIWTALPQIAADELGAAWETVGVEPAPLRPGYANPLAEEEGWSEHFGGLRLVRLSDDRRARITAGSTSVRAFEGPLRDAAATARAMLIAEAAARWGVEPGACHTADGLVLHRGQTSTFGELAEAAATRNPPSNAPRRTGSKARLTGKPLPRLDLASKSDGSFRFASDVRLPDMLFASARLAPSKGTLTAYSKDGIRRVAGIRQVLVQDESLAVAADSWWAAERALVAANPRFAAPQSASRETLRTLFEQALQGRDSSRSFSRGDYESVVEGSRPLTATYWAAPALHLALEPLTATARFRGGHLEVWAPSQAPEFARASAKEAAGRDAAQVTFYPMPVGDPSGGALEAEAIPLAVALARKSGRAVQLILPQATSQNRDHPTGGALARMFALPGAGGITAAWKMKLASGGGFGAALSALAGSTAPDQLGMVDLAGATPAYAIPNVAIDSVSVGVPFSPGYMRGSPEREMIFFIESFIDELARAAGVEPLAFRMSMLGGNPRLAACLQAAASAGGWDGGRSGSTQGIAACSAFGSHIGLLADASVGADQGIEVHRLVAAVDCGRIVNPQLARQQIEGGLIWALAQATVREPEWVAGMPRSRPFGRLGLPRIARTPEIRIQLMQSTDDPGGVSGLGVPPLAPAIANAIYAATGRRLRNLPFDPMAG